MNLANTGIPGWLIVVALIAGLIVGGIGGNSYNKRNKK